MLKTRRQKEIMDMLETRGDVEIKELCQIFGVAEITIRRDLDELAREDAKRIIRTHGGALLSEETVLLEPPYGIRNMQHQQEKEAIARAAAEFIKDGHKIILDSGTTTFTLAKRLDNSKRLIVVTNAVNIAVELNMRTNISVMPVGGILRKHSFSCVGSFAESMIRQLRADISFVGVGGISGTGDLSNGNPSEAGVKQSMLAAGKQKIVLADSSKIGCEEFSIFASLKNIDVLITDSGAPRNTIARFNKLGIKTILAHP